MTDDTAREPEPFSGYDLPHSERRELERRARAALYGDDFTYRPDIDPDAVVRAALTCGLQPEDGPILWALINEYGTRQWQRAQATAVKAERERILRGLAHENHPLDPRTLHIIGSPGPGWWFE